MQEVLYREFVYLWYYFIIQFRQIFRYWILGMAVGSAVSVFAKKKIHGLFQSLPPLSNFLFYMEYMGIIGAMCVAVHYLIAAVQMLKEKMK